MKRLPAAATLLMLSLAACAPEVGTERWCGRMDEKPKGDWTANEAADYAQHCVLGNYKDEEE